MKTDFDFIKIIPVKNIPQDDDFSCGAAMYASIVKYLGQTITLNQAKSEVSTTVDGTRSKNIEDALLKRKIGVRRINGETFTANDLKNLIDNKKVIITAYYNWDEPDGHYCLIVGYTKSQLVLVDPWYPNEKFGSDKDYLLIEFDEFIERWGVNYDSNGKKILNSKLILEVSTN